MTKRTITFVVDAENAAHATSLAFSFPPERLAQELIEAKVDASVFSGRLEDAPPSWAYILLTDNTEIAERAKTPAYKERLARTLGTDGNLKIGAGPRFAQTHGLLGSIDLVVFDDKGPSFLNIKQSVAARLPWPQSISKSADYVRTGPVAQSLASMIVQYLTAALEP